MFLHQNICSMFSFNAELDLDRDDGQNVQQAAFIMHTAQVTHRLLFHKEKDKDKDNDHLRDDHGKNSDGSDNDKGEGAIVLFLLTNVEPNSYQNIVWGLFWGILCVFI